MSTEKEREVPLKDLYDFDLSDMHTRLVCRADELRIERAEMRCALGRVRELVAQSRRAGLANVDVKQLEEALGAP